MNNDRFKFRVWDKDAHEYDSRNAVALSKSGELLAQSVIGFIHYPDSHVIEQCTGLKDKNGRLIYEGDVVLYDKHPVYVVWGRGCRFWLTSTYLTEYGGGKLINAPGVVGMTVDFPAFGAEKRLEVIGNIHEPKWGIESEVKE